MVYLTNSSLNIKQPKPNYNYKCTRFVRDCERYITLFWLIITQCQSKHLV